MPTMVEIKRKLEKVFEERQARVLAEVINEAYTDLVKTSDFNELKEVVKNIGIGVKELAEAQKNTEKRLDSLALRVEELAEAQKNTEKRLDSLALRVEELTEAQKNTEKRLDSLALRVEELTEEVRILARGLNLTRIDLGGLSRSVSYGFENEAFRMLPSLLKEKYKIEIKERMVREEIGGKEINLFGRGICDGKEVLIVGEAKLRLDERSKDVFEELEEKVKAVQEEYKDLEIIRILITHYATKEFLKIAKEKQVLVIQSFEW
jgi:chromosome segregation ATPase